MDRTITRRPTWTPFLLHFAARHAPWRFVFVPLVIGGLLAYVGKLIDRGQLKCWMMRWMLGRPDSQTLDAAVRSFAANVDASGVYDAARAQIAADRAAGATIILATASFDFYVAVLAQHWDIDHVIATRSVRDAAGRLLPRIDGENCYGPAKRAMVERFLEQRYPDGAPPIRFYSDHHSDAPVFALAAQPVATNPNAKLQELAQAKGWPVLDWR